MGEYISLKRPGRPCLTDEEMKVALEENSTLADMTKFEFLRVR